jgi:alpha-N-arabinofuranosidase
MRRIALFACGAAMATALASTARAQAKLARFDWFEYRGNDSIYKTVRADAKHYLNPIIAGFYPDPSMVRVGDDYYLTMSSFAYFPGLPIFHSKDLVNWTQIGSALDRPSQLNLDSAGISRGLFAPAIRYHDGTYYITCTLVDRGGNFVVTATKPEGPWSDPIWLREVDGIDPSLFFDDDGKAYLINNGPPIGTPLYEGHRAIWIQQFDIATKTLVGPRSVIVNGGVDLSKKPIWIEAPHILHVNGMYYLIAAEGGTAMQHSEVVFRSASVRGPYVPYAHNPILTQRHLDPSRPFPITSTGHADFVETPRGEWWAVFLGTRPYGDDLYNTGRETFMLPVHWEDGWPTMLSGSATVPYSVPRPSMPASSNAPVPTAGNFTVRDDFDASALARYWMMIRTPRDRWYDLSTPRGQLTLRARHEPLGGVGQPSFIGRRQQHTTASASTAMQFTPIDDGDRAGITAFHNETHYYLLALAKRGGQTVIELERRAGAGDSTIVASVPVSIAPKAPIWLRVDARGGSYDFYYALRPNSWVAVQRDADGTILSTRKAGGFVGTLFGLYAYSGTP